jgi:hypothetical protein
MQPSAGATSPGMQGDGLVPDGARQARETAFLAFVVGIGLFGFVGVAVIAWSAGTYGVLGWSSTPTRIGYCDQSYTRLDDEPAPLDQLIERDPHAVGATVLEPTIGTLPVGAPLPSGFPLGAGYNGCGPLVLLHLHGGFLRYSKLGGP